MTYTVEILSSKKKKPKSSACGFCTDPTRKDGKTRTNNTHDKC